MTTCHHSRRVRVTGITEMRIPGRRRPGRLRGHRWSNRKPFLSHRKAMGIFESTNGGRRWSGWELQVVTQTSSFRRSIASRPSRLATADEFRDATRFVRAIELLDCPRSWALQQLRQLGDVGRDLSRLILSHEIRRCPPSRFTCEINVADRKIVGVANDGMFACLLGSIGCSCEMLLEDLMEASDSILGEK